MLDLAPEHARQGEAAAWGQLFQVNSGLFLFKESYGILHSWRVAQAWESTGKWGQHPSTWPCQPSEVTRHQLGQAGTAGLGRWSKTHRNCHQQLHPQLQTRFPEPALGMGPCTTLGMETGASTQAWIHMERQGAARETSSPSTDTTAPFSLLARRDPNQTGIQSLLQGCQARIVLLLSWRRDGLRRPGRAGREAADPSPRGEQKRREPVAATHRGLHWSGAETDESEDSGTMGNAGSAGPGTCRDRDMPAWGRAGMGPQGCQRCITLSKPSSRADTEQREKRDFFPPGRRERKEKGELMAV